MSNLKTIVVIYTDKIKSDAVIRNDKKYSFNTVSEVNVGDLIKSPNYTTPMQVVKILDKSYKYYHQVTGDFSNEYTSSAQWDIRTLVINEQDDNVVYGTIINLKNTTSSVAVTNIKK